MSVQENCDSSTCVSSVQKLQLHLADMTVAGASLTSLSITNPVSVPRQDLGDGIGTINPGDLKLVATGRLNGVDTAFVAQNSTAWQATFVGTAFRLQGTIDFLATDQAGKLLPVTVAADITAPAATPQTLSCGALTPIQRLFGFEDPMSWASSAASLSLATSPITQGCGALGIVGQGYIPINGDPFSTVGLALKPALSVDLFIPNNQPNQFWLGALQMYLTCPSGNAFNQYIGQVELTGRPQNKFSTLRFPLPAGVSATLARQLSDCSFSFALNVNQTSRTWVLDSLRFTP